MTAHADVARQNAMDKENAPYSIQDTALLRGIAAAPAGIDGQPDLSLFGALPASQLQHLATLVKTQAQHFEKELGNQTAKTERLQALRAELTKRGLDGFIIPLNDEYHGEYVPMKAQRLAWLTGFTGSAGLAIVLQKKAAVFTDGRYTLQVREQVDLSLYETHHITEAPPHSWITANLPQGSKLGFDPWLHTIDGLNRFERAATRAGSSLLAVEDNPLDAIWQDQPPAPLSAVQALAFEFTGEDSKHKRQRIAKHLKDAGQDAAILTLPESIAWLLNIRGRDVPHTPLPLSFAILKSDATAELFIDQRKLLPEVRAFLGADIAVHAIENFSQALDQLGASKCRVRIDTATASAWVVRKLEQAGAHSESADDPCLLPKATKNTVELAGIRRAHLRDGKAVTRFLCWLEQNIRSNSIDEITAAERLGALRQENEHFKDLSFSTISGSGPNGAIVHYRVTPQTNRQLQMGELYLVDSGAQYLDGTTDITRTIAIGCPSAEMRERYTLVLKGHIALATCLFPEGTTGSQLDVLARHALWQVGLDYDHGTGHGVGAYLSVHEGPQRISKVANTIALRPGMIISNEPGYYKTGAYGIRIENLVAVCPAKAPAGAERKLLSFETLTRAPLDRNLVEKSLLTEAEIAWWNDYHATVRADLTPLLDAETAAWLKVATAPF